MMMTIKKHTLALMDGKIIASTNTPETGARKALIKAMDSPNTVESLMSMTERDRMMLMRPIAAAEIYIL